jgi:hypothetical protein
MSLLRSQAVPGYRLLFPAGQLLTQLPHPVPGEGIAFPRTLQVIRIFRELPAFGIIEGYIGHTRASYFISLPESNRKFLITVFPG